MKIFTANVFKNSLFQIEALIKNFDKDGIMLSDGSRNQIKIFKLDRDEVAIKAFGVPNFINRVVYKYFRKSKAQRSFEYAQKLLSLHIKTPDPVAYAVEDSGLLFGRSYYVCKNLNADLTYRTLVQDKNYPDWRKILVDFAAFTFELHEKGIHFLDHSAGNTLIKKTEAGYDFYLVDLNRMEFKPMSFKTRMHNFSRLTPHREMVAIMAQEYARLANYDPKETEDAMWQETVNFQERFKKKRALKKKLKFWKK